MKVGEEVVVVDEDMAVVAGVIIGTSIILIVHLLTLEHQLRKGLLKTEMLEKVLKGGDMVDLVLPVVSVVAVMGVLPMEKMAKESGLVGYMNVGVGLDMGGYFLMIIFSSLCAHASKLTCV
jgi:hypothetical protein